MNRLFGNIHIAYCLLLRVLAYGFHSPIKVSKGILSTCKSRAHFLLALSWILALLTNRLFRTFFFVILRRFRQVSDKCGDTLLERKSVFSRGVKVAFALSRKSNLGYFGNHFENRPQENYNSNDISL